MARNINFLVIDETTGFIAEHRSLPADMMPDAPPEGHRFVIPEDRVLPNRPMRLDLRKLRKPVNEVRTIDDVVLASWRPHEHTPAQRADITRQKAIAALDRTYAARLAGAAGPLAALHAEKRRQAEAGGGPLVADEVDRLAILANAERQDDAVAAIEAERRQIKAALKNATTEDEIKAALAASDTRILLQ